MVTARSTWRVLPGVMGAAAGSRSIPKRSSDEVSSTLPRLEEEPPNPPMRQVVVGANLGMCCGAGRRGAQVLRRSQPQRVGARVDDMEGLPEAIILILDEEYGRRSRRRCACL